MITKKDAQNFIQTVRQIRETFTDEQAINNIAYFPSWKPNYVYAINCRLKYNNKLYKVIQEHESEENNTPDIAKEYYLELN